MQVVEIRVHSDNRHICALSFFRKKDRDSQDFFKYHDGLLIWLNEFPKVFPSNEWKLCIYHDKSIFSEEHPQETKLIRRLYDRMLHLNYVELIECTMPAFLAEDGVHHRGLMGTFFRFHAISRCQDGLVIIRDVDANVIEIDRITVLQWFNDKTNQDEMHYYSGMGYDRIPAGLVQFKRIKSKRFLDFFNELDSEKTDYGQDEIFLSTKLKNHFRVGFLETYDFYIPDEEVKPDNLYPNLNFMVKLRLIGIFNRMTGKRIINDEDEPWDIIEEFIGEEDDSKGGSSGYLAGMVSEAFRHQYLLWDHLLGDMYPIMHPDRIIVNGTEIIDTSNDDISMDNKITVYLPDDFDPFKQVILLPGGEILTEISLAKYVDQETLAITIKDRDECIHCQGNIAQFLCPETGAVYCSRLCSMKIHEV